MVALTKTICRFPFIQLWVQYCGRRLHSDAWHIRQTFIHLSSLRMERGWKGDGAVAPTDASALPFRRLTISPRLLALATFLKVCFPLILCNVSGSLLSFVAPIYFCLSESAQLLLVLSSCRVRSQDCHARQHSIQIAISQHTSTVLQLERPPLVPTRHRPIEGDFSEPGVFLNLAPVSEQALYVHLFHSFPCLTTFSSCRRQEVPCVVPWIRLSCDHGWIRRGSVHVHRINLSSNRLINNTCQHQN